MHHVEKPERVTRAVGVYEWTGDLAKPSASRFVPVSLFIDGHFEDAGLYLARPVPFALQSGDLYAVEHAGQPAGLLEVETAGRLVSGGAANDGDTIGAWYGFGKFTPEAPPKPAPKLHASSHLSSIQSSSDNGRPKLATKPADGASAGSADDHGSTDDHDRPHMKRRGASGDTSDSSASDSSKADSSKTDSSKGSSNPDSTDTSHSSGSSGAAGGNGTTATASTDSSDDADRPTLRRRDPSQDAARKKPAGGKRGEASVTAAGPQLGDDPDRPTLSRKTAADDGPKELTGLPADMHQAVAVSDPVTRDVHPFARAWDDAAERATTLSGMEALVKPRVEAYLAENRLVLSDATLKTETPESKTTPATAAVDTTAPSAAPRLQRGKPQEYQEAPATAASKKAPMPSRTGRTGTASRSSRTAAKPPAPAPLRLQNEQITGYTLSYGGLPTFVYTAEVASTVANPGNLPTAAANPTLYVTVVAQRLPSGELQPALNAVTDSAHLDRSPRLRLIDAVDPDASHRASLLFEMRAGSSRQFALYRLISAKADQTFTTASIE